MSRVEIDGKRRYATPDGEKLPSVTTILDATKSEESKQALQNWRNRVGVQKAKEPAKTDLSKMKLSSSDNSMPNPLESMMGNADAEDRGGMSRAERRKIERESQKKR